MFLVLMDDKNLSAGAFCTHINVGCGKKPVCPPRYVVIKVKPYKKVRFCIPGEDILGVPAA